MAEGLRNPSLSLEQNKSSLIKVAETSLNALYRIWEEMGIDESQKKIRGSQAVEHVKNLMDAMVKEEQNLKDKMANTVEYYTEKLNVLCTELSLPPNQMSAGLTLVQREKILRAKVETMTNEKKTRLEKYEDLHAHDQQLCNNLDSTPYYIPTGSVPSLEQLKELEKHVTSLQAEKEKRHIEFVATKQKIVDLYNILETDPDTSFSRDLVCEDDDTFKLSQSNMDSLKILHDQLIQTDKEMKEETDDLWNCLKALWNRLEIPDIDREAFELNKEGHSSSIIRSLKEEIKACEQLKFQNMHKFVIGIRNELVTWWNKCFYSEEQRLSFKDYYEENFTEDLLEAHEKELATVQKYYKEHCSLLERIAQREKLFQEMIVFEGKASDPNRFFNDRGGKLLQEEKARKKIVKELPKMEEDVAEEIHRWELENNKQFFVMGKNFRQYVVTQWDDYHLQKEEQKQSRMKAKAKQTHDEMMFGCKSIMSTPGKKKVPSGAGATPQRTPLKPKKDNVNTDSSSSLSSVSSTVSSTSSGASLKQRANIRSYRLNDFPKTPNTTSKLPNNSRVQHSTLLHSPFSRQPFSKLKALPVKTPAAASTSRKRRSIRLMKKAATGRKSSSRRKSRDPSFSHTMVSSEDHGASRLAIAGTYNEFAGGLTRTNCRSSIVPSAAAVLFPLHKH